MRPTLANFRGYVQQQGQRWTAARGRVLETAVAQAGHFDAEELWRAVNGQPGRPVSRATVYRTLPLLAAGGVIGAVAGPRGLIRYERLAGRRHHDHLHCLACDRVIEFASPALETLQDQECRRHGFNPVRHQLVITGYCRFCARPRQAADRA